MENDRLKVHTYLTEAFPDLKIIFRPTSQSVLEYPCITYTVDEIMSNHASNQSYIKAAVFQVTLMSHPPGYEGLYNMLDIPGSSHIRSYMADGIMHDIFNIQSKPI